MQRLGGSRLLEVTARMAMPNFRAAQWFLSMAVAALVCVECSTVGAMPQSGEHPSKQSASGVVLPEGDASGAIQDSDTLTESDWSPDGKTVRLTLAAGGITSSEIFQAIAGDLHTIAGEVAVVIKSLSTGQQGRRLTALELESFVAQFPGILRLERDSAGMATFLLVDRGRLIEEVAEQKSSVRKWLATAQGKQLSSLTKAAGTWKNAKPVPERIVVTMAGLHGHASGAEKVAIQLHRRTGLPGCVFEYPNDGPIADSAVLLHQQLRKLYREYPASKISLVAHSMGGLVSRQLLEVDLRAVKDVPVVERNLGVDQLILVCPPNYGSAIAEYGPLLEGVDQLSRWTAGRRRQSRLMLDMIVDGFNEAPVDLQPGSEFLSQLNAHGRAAGIRYCILAGDKGPLKPGMSLLLTEVWSIVSEVVDEPENLNRRMRRLLDCDDLVDGKGDGVVAVSSARLTGVADFDVLPINHLTWGDPKSPQYAGLLEEIAKRLENSP